MKWLIGRTMPRWFGIAAHALASPLVLAGVPWALSLLGTRHGWLAGWPGVWNLLGLIPVAAGFGINTLCLREHFKAAPDGWRIEMTPHYPTPAYLLTRGPYRYSCHPIYLAEGLVLVGWITFYGSLILLGVIVVASLILGPVIVAREERGLEARFGDVYREYRRTAPRWFGRVRR